jgi:hypothetical protein
MNKPALRWCGPAAILLVLIVARPAAAGEWGMSGRGWGNYSPFSIAGGSAKSDSRCVCQPVYCPGERAPDARVEAERSSAVRSSKHVTATQTATAGANHTRPAVRQTR